MRNIILRRLLTILMSAVLTSGTIPLLYSGVFASAEIEEADHQITNGYIHVDKDLYHVPESDDPYSSNASDTGLRKRSVSSAADLAYYRSDEEPWAEGINVRDQGDSGLCWAFSMATAAEYSYAKEYYEKTGQVMPADAVSGLYPEMSPGHLGYFYYNRENDYLRNTDGDRNLGGSGTYWYTIGGSQMYGMQHLATWSGMASEIKYKFSDIKKNRYKYDKNAEYDSYAALEECELLVGPRSGGEFDTYAVKKLISKYGAVSTAICFGPMSSVKDGYVNLVRYFMNPDETDEYGRSYDSGRSFYNYFDNCDENGFLNHAVTIIGWDDNYPKENFTHTKAIGGDALVYCSDHGTSTQLTEAQALEMTTPERDGAWIVMNSWGPYCHENGIFYVSYESHDFTYEKTDYTAYNMQPADTYTYNFQYDGTADCGDTSDEGNEKFYTKKGTRAANVYINDRESPLSLEAVGFTTFNAGTGSYKIDVYSGLADASGITGGRHVSSKTFTTKTAGVKTITLDEPALIYPGEMFSIVFTFRTENHFGVERARSRMFRVRTDKGQSWFSSSGSSKWTDMNKYEACFRIKGFANIADVSEYKAQYKAKVQAAKKITSRLTSAKAVSGRKAVIKWEKRTKATGYQVAYSTSSSFSSNVKKKTIGKYGTITATLSSLTAGRTYYVKVRTFNSITNKADGKTKKTYGKWSNVRKFTAIN